MNKSPANSIAQPASLLARMESLADANRLRLLILLEQHELGVADLCDIVQLPQSTVSRHLKMLSDQRWLQSRRIATNHLYRMILDEIDPPSRKSWLLARGEVQEWATLRQDALRLERRLRSREIDSESFFATAASDWDRLRRELYGDTFSIAAMLALLSDDLTIADLGCGTGQIIEKLAPHVKYLIGVDSNAAMLKSAKKRLAGFENVDLRRADLQQTLPIDPASCDATMLLLALTYLPDPAIALREAARITKPAGRIVIVDLFPHDRDDFRRTHGQLHRGFPAEQLETLLSTAGFASSKITPLSPEPNAKGPALFLASATRN